LPHNTATPATYTLSLHDALPIYIRLENGPAMIESENAMLRGAVLFNVRDRDLGSTVEEAMRVMNENLGALPEGYFLEWSGQYEKDRKSTRLNSSHVKISYAVFCL